MYAAGKSMGAYMRDQQSPDRALSDMRDKRDHLSIQLSLMRDSQRPTAAEINDLQRQLELLEQRIAKHSTVLDA
jgi:primosomal protein N''